MTRPRTADVLLVVMVVAAVALAAVTAVRPAARAAGAAPGGVRSGPLTVEPSLLALDVLVVSAPTATTAYLQTAAGELGWRLSPPLGLRSPALLTALPGRDVVVVVADEGTAVSAAAAARAVRASSPGVRIVVVGPLGLAGGELKPQRDALRAASLDVGGDFVDPVGSRWRSDLPLSAANPDPSRRRLLAGRFVLAVRGAEKMRRLGVRAPVATPGPSRGAGATPSPTGTVTPSPRGTTGTSPTPSPTA